MKRVMYMKMVSNTVERSSSDVPEKKAESNMKRT